jgi:hypothetical protein
VPTNNGISLRAAVVALVYRAQTRFSLLPEFLTHLGLPLESAVGSFDEVAADLSTTALRLRSGGPIDRLVARDVEAILEATPSEDQFVGAHGMSWSEAVDNPERSLELTRLRIEELLAAHDIRLPMGARPRVVEELPAVRELELAAAMVVDAEDEREFGFEPAVYMRRDALRPIYSDFLYCHEVVHALLGEAHPELVAHGLEEGLADFAGAFWLSGHVLGPQQTERLFLLNRLSHSYEHYWERYLDGARYWCAEYLHSGLAEIIEAVRLGRAGLLEREKRGWRTSETKPSFRASDDDRWLLPMATNVLLRFPRAFVASPEAFLFAENAADGLTVLEIGARAGLSRDQAVRGAAELRDELALIYLRSDGIVVLDAKPARVFEQGWLRYRIGTRS